MSIVKMKHLRLIALEEDKSALLAGLLHVGCVEISEPSHLLEDEDWAGLLHRDTSRLPETRAWQTELKQALDTLQKIAPQKGGLFPPKPPMEERTLLDSAALERGMDLAAEINSHAKTMGQLSARETRLEAERLSLLPWEACDLPLEERGTRTTAVLLGTVPRGADLNALTGALEENAPACAVTVLGQDSEQQYLEVLCHRAVEQSALETLRSFGFAFAQMKELTGTAKANIQRLEAEIKKAQANREAQREEIRALRGRTDELKSCVDRLAQVVATESAKEDLLVSGSVVYLDGWVPVPEVAALERTLAKYDCAWELSEPDPEEYPQVPIKLHNNIFSRCMNTITEMYSLPAYDGVDPNPLMAPFFILFFGMMMADMGYGLLMILGTQFILKKSQPKEGQRNFYELFFWCGVSTFIIGAMTGGFLGDFVPQVVRMVAPSSGLLIENGGYDWFWKPLFTPLNNTIEIMVGSLILGVLQIFTGMTVSVVRKIQNGDFIDALFDEFTWWIILAGVALAIFGIGTVAGIPLVLVVGCLMLAVGGTRKAKGFGKVTSLVGLVYNGVTGYFSDTLSYIRIMALMLAGSVIASVFNTLGATFGNVILFVIISLVGNALNFALNLLGCYVHDLRLQCLEFFNRFYKEGGKPFVPLAIQTNYVNVIKEEN